ncbi:MAG: hypothetical protein HZB20_00210, partial [Chloroflexi bacterium]|nr:hypothetical protein [Chloroflexota bacterium]
RLGSRLIVRSGPPPMQHPLELDFGGELTLHGYSRRGDAVTLAWQAQHPIGVPYGMNVRLTDDAGLVWSDTNIARPADWRFFPGTDFWPTDEFIYDSYLIRPARGAPPGAYHLEAIVYRADTLQALSVQRIGDYVIERPTREPLAAPLANFDGATLVGALPDRATASPGEPYRLTLLWQAASDSPPDRGVRLELVDAAGRVTHAITGGISPQYPPGQWKTGDVIAQSFFLRLPAGVPEGKLHWQVNGVPVAELSVNGLSRSFVLPKLALRFDAAVGQSIKLAGANVRASDRRITIELAWQATSEMADSYRVFVHVLDAGGALVAQSDGEPVNWTRPTSGWLAGEVVLDDLQYNPAHGRFAVLSPALVPYCPAGGGRGAGLFANALQTAQRDGRRVDGGFAGAGDDVYGHAGAGLAVYFAGADAPREAGGDRPAIFVRVGRARADCVCARRRTGGDGEGVEAQGGGGDSGGRLQRGGAGEGAAVFAGLRAGDCVYGGGGAHSRGAGFAAAGAQPEFAGADARRD